VTFSHPQTIYQLLNPHITYFHSANPFLHYTDPHFTSLIYLLLHFYYSQHTGPASFPLIILVPFYIVYIPS